MGSQDQHLAIQYTQTPLGDLNLKVQNSRHIGENQCKSQVGCAREIVELFLSHFEA